MLKIKIKTTQNKIVKLDYLKPRKNLLDWNFNKLLLYIKEELYNNDIEENDVESIIFYDTVENKIIISVYKQKQI